MSRQIHDHTHTVMVQVAPLVEVGDYVRIDLDIEGGCTVHKMHARVRALYGSDDNRWADVVIPMRVIGPDSAPAVSPEEPT